ncbi:MAG: hypothetical protein ACTHNT_07040, partial [Actinomycetales bacterium]
PFDVERLLGGERLDRPDAEDLQSVIDALRAPATARELALEPVAMAAFVRAASTPAPQRKPMLVRLVAGKAAAVAAVACVTLSGAAAYAGVLPPQLQSVAHTVLGAPQPKADDSVASVAAGQDDTTPSTSDESSDKKADDAKDDRPDSDTTSEEATKAPAPVTSESPQAFGLCTAWLAHHTAHGQQTTAPTTSPADDSEAFTRLAEGFGDSDTRLTADDLTTACAAFVEKHHPSDDASEHATGEPTAPGKSGEAHGKSGSHADDSSTEAGHRPSTLPSQASTHAETGDDKGGDATTDHGASADDNSDSASDSHSGRDSGSHDGSDN